MGALGTLAKKGKKAAGLGFTGYVGKTAGEDLSRKTAREADPIGGTVNAAFVKGDIAAAKTAGSRVGSGLLKQAAGKLGKRAVSAVATGARFGAYAPLAVSTAFASGEIANTTRLVKELSAVKKQGREATEDAAAIRRSMYNKYPLKDTEYESPKLSRGSMGRQKPRVVKISQLGGEKADWVGAHPSKPKVKKM